MMLASAQHHLQRIGTAAVLAFGIVAGYLLLQLLPGDQLVHALQELFAAGLALFVLVFGRAIQNRGLRAIAGPFLFSVTTV